MTETDEIESNSEGQTTEESTHDQRIECERRLLDQDSFSTAAVLLWAICPPIDILKTEYPEEILLGLTIAAVTSYGRPFTTQQDRDGRMERGRGFSDLYLKEIHNLGAPFGDLHERMMRLRHKFFAHPLRALKQ